MQNLLSKEDSFLIWVVRDLSWPWSKYPLQETLAPSWPGGQKALPSRRKCAHRFPDTALCLDKKWIICNFNRRHCWPHCADFLTSEGTSLPQTVPSKGGWAVLWLEQHQAQRSTLMHCGFFRVIYSDLIWLLLKENKQINSYAEIKAVSLTDCYFGNRRASSFRAAQDGAHFTSQMQGAAPLTGTRTMTPIRIT